MSKTKKSKIQNPQIEQIDLELIELDEACEYTLEEILSILEILRPSEQQVLLSQIGYGAERKLLKLFPYQYDWLKGKGCPETGTGMQWFKPKWVLTDDELLINWTNPKEFVSVSFGSNTNHIVFDVDVNSPYHWVTERIKLEQCLEQAGINQVNWYRSSGSGGLHGYIPLDKKVQTFDATCVIHYLLSASLGDILCNQSLALLS
jgi:hypothetical protein